MLKKLIYMQSRTKVIRDLKFLRPSCWHFWIYFTYQTPTHYYQSQITGLPGMILMYHFKFVSSLRLFKDKPWKTPDLFNNPTLIPTVVEMEKLPHCTSLYAAFARYSVFHYLLNFTKWMVAYFARHSWKMFVRRPCYKVLCFCGSGGYFCSMNIYTGKSENSKRPSGSSVVKYSNWYCC